MSQITYPKGMGLGDCSKAILVCLTARIPVIMWGPSGSGKSSAVKQLHAALDTTLDSQGRGWKLYDVRTSDKEPTDMGGFPIPNHEAKAVQYYTNEMLPWEHQVGDQRCILFFDEFDRASNQGMVNVLLQLLLDGEVNGHKLGPNVVIIGAANGESSTGTLKMNEAALARCCHIYVDQASPDNVKSFAAWSDDAGCSEGLRRLMALSSSEWETAFRPIACKAQPCPRTKVAADKLLRKCDSVSFDVSRSIRVALVEGCIGVPHGVKFLNRIDFLETHDVSVVLEGGEYTIPEDFDNQTTFIEMVAEHRNTLIANQEWTHNHVTRMNLFKGMLPDELKSNFERITQV